MGAWNIRALNQWFITCFINKQHLWKSLPKYEFVKSQAGVKNPMQYKWVR